MAGGDDPSTVLAAAQLAQSQCVAIDLNCGCPQGIAKRGHYGDAATPRSNPRPTAVGHLSRLHDRTTPCQSRRQSRRPSLLGLTLASAFLPQAVGSGPPMRPSYPRASPPPGDMAPAAPEN
eukprot:6040594-Prymnesium_polylepis.1